MADVDEGYRTHRRFDRAATVLYVKMNRGGQLRFRRYTKRGEAWEMTGELRGLSKISIVE